MSLEEAPTVRVSPLPPPKPELAPHEGELLLLWYCSRCTKLIHPPGEKGAELNGRRFCAECAPFETANQPATSYFTTTASGRIDFVRGSSARMKVADAVEVTAPKASSGRMVPVTAAARPNSVSSARMPARPPSRKLKWAGAAAIAAMFLLVAGIFIKGGAFQAQKPTNAAVIPPKAPKLSAKQEAPPPPPRPLTEQEKRQQALSQGGGLFGNLRPDENAAPPTAIKPAPEAKPEAVEPAPKIEELEARLEALQPLLEKERFSEAGELLETLKKKYSSVPGWDAKQNLVADARDLFVRRYATFEQSAADATAQAQTASNLAALDELEKSWKPRMALGNMSAKQAGRVLDAAQQSRSRLSAESDKRLASFGDKLMEIEKHSKGKLSKADMDQWLKAMQAIEDQLRSDPATAKKIAERFAAVNVSLRLARGPEKLFYNLEPCAGEKCDLKYDFASAEQAAPWKFDGDGEFQIDAKKKSLTLAVTSQRARNVFEAAAPQRSPSLQLPFLFSAANWTIEADVAVTKSRDRENKDQNPVYGILISDGGANVLRFSAQESSKGVLQLNARVPGAENEKDKQARMPGKQSDKLRLRMDCRNGVVGFGASAAAHPASSGHAKLSFEPKFVGVFLEARDPEESAALTVSSFKLSGSWDSEKLKAAIEARRAADSASLKSELKN